MSEQLLAQVEAKLDLLIERYRHLESEHQKLREREQSWLTERDRLLEKNEIARTRINDMITRLKQFEADTE